jgi:hypothetical protein
MFFNYDSEILDQLFKVIPTINLNPRLLTFYSIKFLSCVTNDNYESTDFSCISVFVDIKVNLYVKISYQTIILNLDAWQYTEDKDRTRVKLYEHY